VTQLPNVEAPRSGRRGVLAAAPMVAAALTGLGALAFFLFGVILTAGVYGSRMAWLLGVVLPLLGITAMLAWLASKAEVHASVKSHLRAVATVALGLIAIPFVLAGLLLTVYLLLFIRYELARLIG
jgi:hypothetical protein